MSSTLNYYDIDYYDIESEINASLKLTLRHFGNIS